MTGRPRLIWPFRLALGLVIVVTALFALRQVSSPDVGFHLTVGNYILDGNGWPQTDPFTYTVNDHAYVDNSWGYQVVLSLAERMLGAPGMVLLTVALTLALFTLIVLTARVVPGELHVLAPLLLLAGLAVEPRLEVRPEVWSYTLLAALLYLLHRHAEGRRAPLWLLPVIFVVWVNSHSLFVLGWAALGCFVAGLAWRDRKLDRPLLGWSAAAVAIGLVNPYGWRGLTFPFVLATRMGPDNVFKQRITEFPSPLDYLGSDQLMFFLVPLLSWLLFALLTLVSLPTLVRQRRYWCVLLAAVFLPLSLTMIRNIPPFAVACLPGGVFGLSFARTLDGAGLRGRARRLLHHAFLGLVLLVTLVVGLRVTTDAYYVASRRTERFGLGWNEGALPLAAARWASGAGLEGRMLNHLNFGATLMWMLDQPVFIDGRLEVMGEAFYKRYRAALDSPAGLAQAVRDYGIGWIVFPYRLEPDLMAGLSGAPDWRLVYVDAQAALFVRGEAATPPDASVARLVRAATEPVTVSDLPGLGGGPRAGVTRRFLAGLVGRQRYPTESFNRGVLHFQQQRAGPAAAAFAEAIRESGGAYYEIYNNLGSSLHALGRLDEARACYRLYLDELPFCRREPRRRVRSRLAEIERRDGS
jgi:tetratricopeptide (TPR) repeat protein